MGRETPKLVPLCDLQISEADIAGVEAVLRSGRLSQGERAAAFERLFADHLGVAHALLVANCTTALQLAYLAAGVGPGDEVIVPSYTFVATAATVIHCGATPVFADIIGPHDLSIDPDHVAALITPATKAVTAVHFAGYPAPVDRLRALCDARGLTLVEDAAHAPSATLHGGRLGSYGIGCFSFFSNKVLSAGEGGLLATDDPHVHESARRRAEHFIDEPRAALLTSRFARLEDDIARRRMLTRRYRAALESLDAISVPYTDAQVDDASCHVMPMTLNDATRRDGLRARLREVHGIQTSVLYPPVHRFSAYRERYPRVALPRTEAVSAAEVTLPLYAHLSTADQDRVIAAVRAEA